MRRLWRKIHHDMPEIKADTTIAMRKPNLLPSMPFIRFMPKMLAISVGNIRIIETEVSVRITVFMLLLMMLEYVSIVDSRMSGDIFVGSRAWLISMFTSSMRSASSSSTCSLNFSLARRFSLPRIDVMK